MVRVLKPGGRFVLCDFRNTDEYARALTSMGVIDARKKLIDWIGFYPMFAAIGTKPEAADAV